MEIVPNPMYDRQYPNMNAKQHMDTISKLMNLNFPSSHIRDRQRLTYLEKNYRFVRLLKKADGQQTFLRVFEDPQVMPTGVDHGCQKNW